MLLPLATRFLRAYQASVAERDPSIHSSDATAKFSSSDVPLKPLVSLSPPLSPISTPGESVLIGQNASYDTPNTFLSKEALELPERQCTLCLEPRGTGEGSGGTVAVTECGHIFCWGCLGGLEKVSLLRLGSGYMLIF